MTHHLITGQAAKPRIKSFSYFLSRLLTPDFRLHANDAQSAFDLRPQTFAPALMKHHRTYAEAIIT